MMTETVVNVQEAPNNNAAPNKPQGGSEQALPWLKINLDYFKTTPGLLKIAEFFLIGWVSNSLEAAFLTRITAKVLIQCPMEIEPLHFVLGIFCMGLGSPPVFAGAHFFMFVVTVSFIGTIIWIVIYLLGIREAVTFPINWILTEFVNTGLCTVGYFIAFILQLIGASTLRYAYYRRGASIAAGVFGILNFLVYGFATYLLQVEWKRSRTNQ